MLNNLSIFRHYLCFKLNLSNYIYISSCDLLLENIMYTTNLWMWRSVVSQLHSVYLDGGTIYLSGESFNRRRNLCQLAPSQPSLTPQCNHAQCLSSTGEKVIITFSCTCLLPDTLYFVNLCSWAHTSARAAGGPHLFCSGARAAPQLACKNVHNHPIYAFLES
jgi:hypothetical protein